MTDIMFYIPTDETIEKVVIMRDTVEKKLAPMITYNENRQPLARKLRFLVCGSYLDFYRLQSKEIFIDRILYIRRGYLTILFGGISQVG